MWGLLFFIAVYIGVGIYQLINGNIEVALFSFAFATLIFGIFYFFKKERDYSNDFCIWAMENKECIYDGKAEYNGIRITPDTEIVRCSACISILFFSFKAPSRFLIKDYHHTYLINFVYSITTLLFGWWAFPLGPINTIKVLFNNIRMHERITIEYLIYLIEDSEA
ncbi:MAG: hypothetical protein K0R93_1232 [Anaerosolibacter sp.]|jgi:hypothetical protein|uniref:hypothetical protein n=1 Tax=Anaerosolibacter sp. TaxID=1872527 RepID=UPI0026143D38|nr:hypothetical protein [Anaerosolibacter sp.]MDF2546334.1 hypothetical protein [Anaerosolibacter sp.]